LDNEGRTHPDDNYSPDEGELCLRLIFRDTEIGRVEFVELD